MPENPKRGGALVERLAISASPSSSGYVDVGALEMYYERHGDGPPLVLLHGAFGTIESCFANLLPELARHFEVIAVEPDVLGAACG